MIDTERFRKLATRSQRLGVRTFVVPNQIMFGDSPDKIERWRVGLLNLHGHAVKIDAGICFYDGKDKLSEWL